MSVHQRFDNAIEGDADLMAKHGKQNINLAVTKALTHEVRSLKRGLGLKMTGT